MGYWSIRITPEHYELKDDRGRTIASVKGLETARLFARSWDMARLLEAAWPRLEASGEEEDRKLARRIQEILKEKPEEVKTR